MSLYDPHFSPEDQACLQMEMKSCLQEMQDLEKQIKQAEKENDQKRVEELQRRYNSASDQYNNAHIECVDKYGPGSADGEILESEYRPIVLESEKNTNFLSL